MQARRRLTATLPGSDPGSAGSNRVSFVRGTSELVEIDLVDDDGDLLAVSDLAGIGAVFQLRKEPSDGIDVLRFDSAVSSRVVVDPARPKLLLVFLADDTALLDTGVYFYQVTLTAPDGEPSVVIEWTPFELGLGGSAEPPLPAFDNTVKVDHDYQLGDDLQYVSPGGSPIENAQVRLYYKSDYVMGKLDAPIGVTRTNAAGRWLNPILVTPGFSFIVRMEKPGEWGPDTREIFA